jgi:phosphatidylglycerol---prolipoprotein diacylglyceryl transferase
MEQHTSFPVHPTQIYEAIVGLLLLGLLLWQRKKKRFEGQIFYLFVFAYGSIRFMLEILRDDEERGDWGPAMGQHILVPLCMVLLAIAFAFGISLGIADLRNRMIARGLAFIPAVALYLRLAPAQFGEVSVVQLSTSQLIALLTSLLAAYFYARGWDEAGRPKKTKKAKAKLEAPPTEAGEDADADDDEAQQPV